MNEPYVYKTGRFECSHENVSYSTLLAWPGTRNWECSDCGRVVRQTNQVPRVVMPEVPDERTV